MKRTILVIVISFIAFFNAVSQEDIIKVTDVHPLYCLDRYGRYNYECIDRVRMTFSNSDWAYIQNVTFILTLSVQGDSGSTIVYKVKHTINLEMYPEETRPFDLPLLNPISVTDSGWDLEKESNFRWSVVIDQINK